MKKVLSYILIIVLLVLLVADTFEEEPVIRVQLPHGAVLHVLPASKKKQAHGAVILCPGGGYGYLERWYEGRQWFPFFHSQGFAVSMLEYRLPNHNHQNPVIDGVEAIRLMRKHAKEWGFDSNNVGVVGFSAGGHLASTLMVNDKLSSRPDFGILFYPVISMKKELTHKGSHDNLLGGNASEQLENRYSNELHVSDHTPPAYIVVCSNDQIVNPQNAMLFYEEMRAKKCPVTLRVYPSGGHGWGGRPSFAYHEQMLEDLTEWLNSRNYLHCLH